MGDQQVPEPGSVTPETDAAGATSEPASPASPAPASPAPADGSRRGAGIARSVVSILLCVVGVLCLVLSPVTIWGRNLLLDTNRYVQTVTPLADSPAVQDAVVAAVVKQVDANIDTSQILDQVLPTKVANVLAAPTQSAINNLVQTVATKFVQSKAFRTLWVTINRAAHKQIVALLTGKQLVNGDVSVAGGVVSIDLTQVVQNVKDRLVTAGIAVASNIPVAGTTLQIARVKGLEQAQALTRFLNNLANWLPFIGLALVAGGVYLARRHRRAVIACALGLAGGMVVIGLGLALGRHIYLNDIPADQLPRAAAQEIFDILVRYLRNTIRVVLVVALLIAFGVWLSGASKQAVAIRGAVVRTTQRFGSAHVHAGPVSTFVARYTGLIRAGILGLAGLILLMVDHPSPWTVVLLAVLALIGLGVVEVVRAPGARAAEPETAGPPAA